MFFKNILSKIFLKFPEGGLKDKIRSFIYNRSSGQEFSISKTGKVWTAKYSGYDLNFYDETIPYHILLTNYLFTHYFPQKRIDILIDAGAFIGTFSFYAAKKYPQVQKVIALEPDPLNFSRINNNLKINNLPEFEILPYGLWNRRDTLDFSEGEKLKSSIHDISQGKNRIRVEVDTLDNLLRNTEGKRLFIKMNIEGAELEALPGCSKIVKNNKVHFAIAADHMVDGTLTTKRVEELCSSMNLFVTTIQRGQYITVYANNESAYPISQNGL